MNPLPSTTAATAENQTKQGSTFLGMKKGFLSSAAAVSAASQKTEETFFRSAPSHRLSLPEFSHALSSRRAVQLLPKITPLLPCPTLEDLLLILAQANQKEVHWAPTGSKGELSAPKDLPQEISLNAVREDPH